MDTSESKINRVDVSRVYALAGQGENAMRHAERALHHAAGSPAFFVAYAHEAIARAAQAMGDDTRFRKHLAEAQALAAAVADVAERKQIEEDLDTLELATDDTDAHR